MRPAIVFLHGFTHTGASWRAVIEELGERYSAIAPDLRGHGAASDRRPVSFAACAGDVAEAAPERFALVGYSMGGRVALHTALAHPERVERLVLVGAGPGIADEVERNARREQDEGLAAEIEGSSIESFADRWGALPILKGQSPEVAARAREDRLRNQPDGLAAALRGLGAGTMEPLWGSLDRLRMPVTLVTGERDAKYRKIAERMAAAVPDARALAVPAAGHAVHLEAPRLMATLIADALSNLGAASIAPRPG